MAVATNALTYNGFTTQICNLAVVNTSTVNNVVTPSDPALASIMPQLLNYAELRIQRDLDLYPLQTTNTYTLTAGTNQVSIPVSDFVDPRTFTIFSGGQTYPLTPATQEFLQNVYGSSTGTGIPQYFAPYGGDAATDGNTSNIYILGPWPDQNYTLTISGLVREVSLYQYANQAQAGTSTTFISTYLPDLLVFAGMIYVTAYQRDFSAMSDQPDMGPNYENQYQTLLKGAAVEEARKRYQSGGWTSMSPALVATPTRG